MQMQEYAALGSLRSAVNNLYARRLRLAAVHVSREMVSKIVTLADRLGNIMRGKTFRATHV